MRQTIELHFTPTQADYSAVLRKFFWRHTSTKISLVALVGAFALVLYVVLSKGGPPSIYELFWLVLPPLFVVYIFFMQPRRIAHQAAQNERLMADVKWYVTPNGVEISSTFETTLLDWPSLSKLVEAGEYYLLLSKAKKNAFRFLPRRVFISSQDEEEFRELVQEYIPITR
jgi:hypothetical protein